MPPSLAACSTMTDRRSEEGAVRWTMRATSMARSKGDSNPHNGEISLNLGLNSKTGEKSPDQGSHGAMVAGAPQSASSGFRRLRSPGAARLRCPRVRTVAGADSIIALRCREASRTWEAICNTPDTQTRTA